MFQAYGKFWKNYVKFDGKSSRSDYWWVFLINGLIGLVLFIIAVTVVFTTFAPMIKFVMDNPDNSLAIRAQSQEIALHNPSMILMRVLMSVLGLAVLLPTTALTARRLRDAAFPWWLALISGAFSLFFLLESIFMPSYSQSTDSLSSFIILENSLSYIAMIYYLIVNIIFCAMPSKKAEVKE
jgi:uncharacterized membrane protein YhaH (DUF805 family)